MTKHRIQFRPYNRVSRNRMTWILPGLCIYRYYAGRIPISWIISMGWLWFFLDIEITDIKAEKRLANTIK